MPLKLIRSRFGKTFAHPTGQNSQSSLGKEVFFGTRSWWPAPGTAVLSRWDVDGRVGTGAVKGNRRCHLQRPCSEAACPALVRSQSQSQHRVPEPASHSAANTSRIITRCLLPTSGPAL
jgi:hypothetical protein